MRGVDIEITSERVPTTKALRFVTFGLTLLESGGFIQDWPAITPMRLVNVKQSVSPADSREGTDAVEHHQRAISRSANPYRSFE
jgi:hypothetical protein